MKKNGWLILDKPLGMTSTRIGGLIKRKLKVKKVGHVGTLDPLASGVLCFAVGEATKLIPYLDDSIKKYRFQVRFGIQTTTDDLEGDSLKESDHRPSLNDINSVLQKFIGNLEQMPPIYSAIKVDGERAYDRVRKGEKISLKTRSITIHDLALINHDDVDHATFYVTCAKGTYVRSLARDMAEALGTVGTVSVLRRLQSGTFFEDDCLPFSALENHDDTTDILRDLAYPFGDKTSIKLNEHQWNELQYGRHFPVNQSDQTDVFTYYNGNFCSVGSIEQGSYYPKRLIKN